MSLQPELLFISLITGGIGLVLLTYGKKQDRWPHLVAGLALMAYPYFVETVAMTIALAVAILVALWLAVRSGW